MFAPDLLGLFVSMLSLVSEHPYRSGGYGETRHQDSDSEADTEQ